LLNIDGVVQGEVQEVTPSYNQEKEVQVKRNGIEFWRVEKLENTIKYTCCKSKFAISKQKEM
jgi:hypothetical protein